MYWQQQGHHLDHIYDTAFRVADLVSKCSSTFLSTGPFFWAFACLLFTAAKVVLVQTRVTVCLP